MNSNQCARNPNLQDQLTGALIGLARVTDGNSHLINPSATEAIIEGLCATQADANCGSLALQALLERADDEKRKMVPGCYVCTAPCGKTANYDMDRLLTAGEEIRSLKHRILSGIRCMAVHARHAALLGCRDKEVDRFFYKALTAVSMDDFEAEDLLPILQETEEMNRRCMALLNRANTDSNF